MGFKRRFGFDADAVDVRIVCLARKVDGGV